MVTSINGPLPTTGGYLTILGYNFGKYIPPFVVFVGDLLCKNTTRYVDCFLFPFVIFFLFSFHLYFLLFLFPYADSRKAIMIHLQNVLYLRDKAKTYPLKYGCLNNSVPQCRFLTRVYIISFSFFRFLLFLIPFLTRFELAPVVQAVEPSFIRADLSTLINIKGLNFGFGPAVITIGGNIPCSNVVYQYIIIITVIFSLLSFSFTV